MDREPTVREFNTMIIEERGGKRPKYLRKFWDFHDINPDVFEELLVKAKRCERQGFKHFGVKWLAENLRHAPIATVGDTDGLKLSNSLVAYYARFLILVRPSLGERIKLCPLGRQNRQRPDDPPTPVVKDEPMTWRLKVFWMTRRWPEPGSRNGRQAKRK